MASNPHKWVRKRPADDSESPELTSVESFGDGFENWKVKTLEEILEEKRRKKLKGENYEESNAENEHYFSSSPRSDEAGRLSKSGSQQSSPRIVQGQTASELAYALSPEHDSFLESPGKNNEASKDKRSSRDSTPHSTSGQLERRTPLKSVEEEGEIVSDVSDEEEAGETSSEEKRPWRKEEKTDKKQEEKMEVSSAVAEEETGSSSSEDSDSGSESNSESDSSSDDEEEEEEERNTKTEKEKENGTGMKEDVQENVPENTVEQNETKNTEISKAVKTKDEGSESSGDSESGSGSDSDSESTEESSESEREEEEEAKKKEEKLKQKENEEEMEETEDLHKELARVNQKQNVKQKDVKRHTEKGDSRISDQHFRISNQKAAKEKHELSSKHEHKHRHKYHHENVKKHRHSAESRQVRERQHEEMKLGEKSRGASSVGKERTVDKKHNAREDENTHKQDTHKYRTNEKSKSKERKGKESKHGKDKVEKKREEDKSKQKTSKSPKARSKTTDEKKSRTEHRRRKSAEKKVGKDSAKLTETEKNKFSDEVVDVEQSDSSINEEDFESISEEESLSEAEQPADTVPEVKELPPYEPAIQGCRSVDEFLCINRIEEGTYGVVYRAKDKRTGEIVALKKLKMEREKEGFPITSLREVSTLLKAQHPNIVTVREIVVGNNMDKIYIVMDYVEHDLKTLMEHMNQPFYVGEVKTLMIQLLRAVQHLHDNWILHRDLKASNLLLSNKGMLKVGDFGLAREYGSPLKNYTPIVVTLWYRAPELLLGVKEYSTPVDLWSVGCIFAELLTRKPLFPGKSEIDQINLVFKELGTPSDKIWPGPPAYSELPHVKKMTFTEYPYNSLRNRFDSLLTDKGFDLMNRFLTYDPKKRINAEEALRHSYFDESPKPVDPSMFPSWPAKSEMAKLPKHRVSPKAPEGGAMFSKLVDEQENTSDIARKLGTVAAPGFSLKFSVK